MTRLWFRWGGWRTRSGSTFCCGRGAWWRSNRHERGWPSSAAGPDEKALKAYAREIGLQRCHFLGSRPNGYRYFASADAGVICSMYEGQPLALIEAMFVRCPMVGTAVDGIAETIVDGETGLLVPAADPAALADAIVRLLGDPQKAKAMGEAARKRAAEKYSYDKILRSHLDLALGGVGPG